MNLEGMNNNGLNNNGLNNNGLNNANGLDNFLDRNTRVNKIRAIAVFLARIENKDPTVSESRES